jgi:predicted ATPase
VESFESVSRFMTLDLLVPFMDLIFFQTMKGSVWLCMLDTKFFQLEALLFFTRNLVRALDLLRAIKSSWVLVV